MTPEDKEFARAALEQRWLTIEQVEELKRVAVERRATLRDVAVASGLVRERTVAPAPRGYMHVLVGTIALFVVGSAVIVATALVESRARERENARWKAETDRQSAASPRETGDLTDAIEAERRLKHARDALRYVESNRGRLSRDEEAQRLAEALQGFDAYLAHRPEAAAAWCDRGRARDLRGQLPEALADYEQAMKLDAALVPAIRPRVEELRAILGRR